MELGKLRTGVSPGLVTLRKALTDSKVVRLAGLLNIDLNDTVKRNTLLANAMASYESADALAALLPVGNSGVGIAVRPRMLTHYYVAQALQAYQEVATL